MLTAHLLLVREPKAPKESKAQQDRKELLALQGQPEPLVLLALKVRQVQMVLTVLTAQQAHKAHKALLVLRDRRAIQA